MSTFKRFDNFTGIFAPLSGGANKLCAMLLDAWTEDATAQHVSDVVAYECADTGYQKIDLTTGDQQVMTSTDTMLFGTDQIDYKVESVGDPINFTSAQWIVIFEASTLDLIAYAPFGLVAGYAHHAAFINSNSTLDFYTLGDNL